MLHAERVRNVDVIYLGASYSGVFGQIDWSGGVTGTELIVVNPTPLIPLEGLRVSSGVFSHIGRGDGAGL